VARKLWQRIRLLLSVPVLALGMVAVWVVPARAANEIEIGMPFAGKWAYNVPASTPWDDDINDSHPAAHDPVGSGDPDWATDLYAAAGTDLGIYFSGPAGTKVKANGTWDSSCSGAGSGIKLDVYIDNTKVGQVTYAHLVKNTIDDNGSHANNDGYYDNGAYIGEIVSGSSGCYGGGHTHVEFNNVTNHACYLDFGQPGSSTISAGTAIGEIGSGNGGNQQVCAVEEEEETPPTPPQLSSSGVIALGSQLHTFYYDATNGNLRHAWWAGSWGVEDFDGNSTSGGRVNADVGRHPTALVINNQPHAFYYDATNGNLRHAWWNTGTSSWSFENFDGDTTSGGRINGDVGKYVSVTIYNGQPHLFYYDATNGNLRHSWWNPGISSWSFEDFDGSSTTAGRLNANVGQFVSPVVIGEGTGASMHVYYYDVTNGDLRHAWYANTTTAAQFETFDGNSTTGGRVSADAGQYVSTVSYGSQPHVFYYDTTNGNLRHGWWNTGTTAWSFENLDGDTTTGGRLNANVGSDVASVAYNNQIHLFYYDATNGNQRHSWWDNTAGVWSFATSDGATGTEGNLDANLGQYNRVAVLGDALHTYYYDATNGNVRHMWWTNHTSPSQVETFDGTTGTVGGLNADIQ
jgi:hypothetical protein